MAGALSKMGRVFGTLLMILGLLFLLLGGGIGYVYLTKKGEVSFDSQKYAFKFSLEAPAEKAVPEKDGKPGKEKTVPKATGELDFSKPAIDQLNYAQNYNLPQEYKAGEYFRAARSENLSKLEKDLDQLNKNMQTMQAMEKDLDKKLSEKEKERQDRMARLSNDAIKYQAKTLDKMGEIEAVVNILTDYKAEPPTEQKEIDYCFSLFYWLSQKRQIEIKETLDEQKKEKWNHFFSQGFTKWKEQYGFAEKKNP